ncbi:MAG TPA: nickel pincer cofactor biosynthesis protein LarC [Thermomicrobiales bacterium]|nr:nickel pincer cofactor biosynthesis protein LarC [Thermomicrobiales bacterium]
MKIAHFDPFSGASGDMILGALVDAGVPLTGITTELSKLQIEGYRVRAERAGQHGIHGTRVTVDVIDDVHSRTWSDIRTLIEDSLLDDTVKAATLQIFERLAVAEAKIHNSTPDHVHFHEVGGIDAIVDICGACIGFSLLGVEAITCAPFQLGHGFAQSAHGTIPVPAPATLELIADANAPVAKPAARMSDNPAELLTPTGAAILTTLATFDQPSFAPATIGYGFGQKELPWPNALRVWIGEVHGDLAGADGEILLETNLDDMNPQFLELALERLFEHGALDAWTTPITMKKGRPATQLSVLAPASRRQELESAMIENTSTLGIRVIPIDRTKAARIVEAVTTRWGDIRIKHRIWNGRTIDIVPEYDDCLRIAREHGIEIRTVWQEAFRIGEARIGQRR